MDLRVTGFQCSSVSGGGSWSSIVGYSGGAFWSRIESLPGTIFSAKFLRVFSGPLGLLLGPHYKKTIYSKVLKIGCAVYRIGQRKLTCNSLSRVPSHTELYFISSKK